MFKANVILFCPGEGQSTCHNYTNTEFEDTQSKMFPNKALTLFSC